MKNKYDFHADFDNLELSAINFQRMGFGEAWATAYRYSIDQAHIELNREPNTSITLTNAHEMLNMRNLPKPESWDEYFAEEARKLN